LKKLYPLSRLKELIQTEKNKGKRIVLANGCFDLIHTGHIRYLKEAKQKGDLLVLALNSDSSVRRLKGKGRPILNEKERIEILSAFSFIDYITIFQESNVEKILLTLKPNIHAKGSDYTKETVPEKETVKSYGGSIAIVGGAKVNSTSHIIERIAAMEKTSNFGGDNFLIIRFSSLGDIIHTLPAFSALRKKFPKARISWLVERKGKEILEFVPGIDEVIVIDTENWRLKNIGKEIALLKRKIKNKYEVALDFQGLIKSGFISYLSRSRKRIGFQRKNLKESFASLFYNEKLEELPEDIHVISKNLKLLEKVGIQEEYYEFPIQLPPELLETVKAKLKKIGYEEKKKLILLNVGAGWETKRWFPERWVELVGRIKREDLFPLLLWGTEEEKSLASIVNQQTSVPIAPYLSVKEAMALVKMSSVVLSGDTFALQVACAFSVPVVGIFGPTNPRRNGPFSTQDKVAVQEIKCSFCFKRTCPTLECLEKITVNEVTELFSQLLKENA
jgi:heptosyltransferase-1